MSVPKNVRFLSLEPQQDLIKKEVSEALADVYSRAHYILGERLKEFESGFADYCGARFAIGVGSGLDALEIALASLGVGRGDEVIVPANTYAATWLAVTNVGATVVPVEPDERTYNIDPIRIEAKISAKTKAIIPVHLYGQACDMAAISSIAEKHQIPIIEDNAQAHGASWAKKRTGSWGTINATSFYPTKNLGALGDGGALTTSNEAIAEFCRAFRNYGSAKKNFFEIPGINSRLDEIQAAILLVKLKHLEIWNEQRRTIAEHYDATLSKVPNVKIPYCKPDAFHVYHQYVIQVPRRDELQSFLLSRGIETMIHYPIPPHLQTAFKSLGFSKGDFPITESLSSSILSLPIWPGMKESEMDYVATTITAFFN